MEENGRGKEGKWRRMGECKEEVPSNSLKRKTKEKRKEKKKQKGND